jgi:membrane-associated protein
VQRWIGICGDSANDVCAKPYIRKQNPTFATLSGYSVRTLYGEQNVIDFILHIDDNLKALIAEHGAWVYGILSGIIFAETGFVVTPFLPGDSLLFAAGIFTTKEGGLNLFILGLCLHTAAVAGDNVNYWIGRTLGQKLFKNENSKIFKKSSLQKTEKFFERHGSKTLIMARWVAIIRTFAPFVAGMGKMHYPKFMMISIIGGAIWVWSLIIAGHFLGQFDWVVRNLEYVILGIVLATIPLILFEAMREKKRAAKEAAEAKMAAQPEV